MIYLNIHAIDSLFASMMIMTLVNGTVGVIFLALEVRELIFVVTRCVVDGYWKKLMKTLSTCRRQVTPFSLSLWVGQLWIKWIIRWRKSGFLIDLRFLGLVQPTQSIKAILRIWFHGCYLAGCVVEYDVEGSGPAFGTLIFQYRLPSWNSFMLWCYCFWLCCLTFDWVDIWQCDLDDTCQVVHRRWSHMLGGPYTWIAHVKWSIYVNHTC